MKKNQGFTLIELLIAMFVGLIVLGATYAVFIAQNKELNKQEQIAVMQQNARMAMEMMTREIMMAGYNQTTNPVATPPVQRCTNALVAVPTPCIGITIAAPKTISFVADLNGNGDTTAGTANPNENIVYDRYYSETSPAGVYSLGRTSNGRKQPVVEYVESLDFKYYPADGEAIPANETAILKDIRRIQISITTRTANIDPALGAVRTFTLTSNVTPRNLGLTGY